MSDVTVKQPDNLPELLGVIKDTMQNLSDSQSEAKEKQAQMETDIREQLDSVKGDISGLSAKVEAVTEKEETENKAFWDAVSPTNKTAMNLWGYSSNGIIEKALYHPVTKYDHIKRGWFRDHGYMVDDDVMKMNDMLMIYGMQKCIQENGIVTPREFANHIKSTQTYDLLRYELSRDGELRRALKALDTTDTSNWVPTQMSAQFIDDVRLQLKVAALFPRIQMPNKSGSFDVPLVGAKLAAYLIGESTGDSATAISTRDANSSKVTFSAIKHAVRMLFSDELDEDSMVAIYPMVQKELSFAVASAEEDACINGDTAGTHFDSDVTSTIDVNKSWDGLRKAGGTNNSGAPSGNAATDISTLSVDNLLTMRKGMGRFGVNASELAYITGISGYVQMLALDEVQTLDKYGANATILSGELAKLNGAPIIVSEFIKEDLNTNGYQDGVTETDTVILLANTKSFWFGDKGTPRSDSERDIDTQQTKVVVSRRLDFQEIYTPGSGEDTIAVGYSLTS